MGVPIVNPDKQAHLFMTHLISHVAQSHPHTHLMNVLMIVNDYQWLTHTHTQTNRMAYAMQGDLLVYRGL